MNDRTFFKNLTSKAGFKTFTSVALAIAFGLLVGFVVLFINNPGKSFQGFGGILIGAFGNPTSPRTGIGEMLYYATPIMLTGLSVGFAFKSGMFNIGAAGQFVVGQFAAIIVAFYGQAFGPFQWIVAVLAGILVGALWGFFVGIFKAFFNVNEVITAIMFNYIGLYLVNFLVKSNSIIYNMSEAKTKQMPEESWLPTLGLGKIFPESSLDIGILIAILVAIGLYIIINKTTFGYEITAVGHNKDASRYAGINEKKSIILSMSIAGAISGLAGALNILSPGYYRIGMDYAPENILPSAGFNGIPVALLGLSNPIAIIFSALFITYLQLGGNYTQTAASTDIIDIIVAIIIYFSAFAMLARIIIAKYFKKGKVNEDETAAASLSGTNSKPDIDTQSEV